MAETNYNINYDDERFKAVENERDDRLNQINDTYNNMINQSDQFYQNQIDAAKDYATTQQDLQNQQTQLAIDEINQQKERAEKDYQREQRGAYTDWQKQSNRYGVEAERQATAGLNNTGYSESSQVSMYNTYQNRVSTARDSYNLAIQNYDNGIAQARLANNSKLAEIAYQALQTELELSLNGFQYKNTLLLDQIGKQQQISDTYYNRWQNVLSQMNTENALAEQIRQYNEKMAYQKERDKVADKQWEKQYKLAKKSASRSYSSGGSSKKKTKQNAKLDNGSGKETDKTVTSDRTPILSSKKAQNFFSNLSKTDKTTTEKALKGKVKSAYDNKILNDNDVKMVLGAYGLN